MRHLTFTGAIAGSTLCLRRLVAVGDPFLDQSDDGDTFVHWVGTPDDVIDEPETCEACRHAARCLRDDCAWCEELGYRGESDDGDLVEPENMTPQR